MVKNYAFFLFLVFSLFSAGCSNGQTISNESRAVTFMGPKEYNEAIRAKDVVVLDVRRESEFKSGNIKNALWADWLDKQEFYRRIDALDTSKPVYLYCLSGGRSKAAAEYMAAKGFKVTNLKGGINAWKQAGFKMENQKDEPQIEPAVFEASIPKSGTVLLDFGAEWCAPCVKMKPVLDQFQKDNPGLQLIKVDAGTQDLLMQHWKIGALPTLLLFKDGIQKWRSEGLVEKTELEKAIRS